MSLIITTFDAIVQMKGLGHDLFQFEVIRGHVAFCLVEKLKLHI